ncbi:S-adenosyl-L-methionine-dependent methyltransferase [Teratosphaeria nubilosa]|uniref:S-adenosyl-L-methionine-dependent methyltransferase n=1 Tax=Teratosphaeria nubilosa TaxID=161662 RepID=A0A6G1LB91_9PEZI|nr:S-adenosyl-L-methionine-dependent methyltransferase [Teratosphaeria nubilosa]
MGKDANEELSRAEYWDARYSAENEDAKAYDWLRQFQSIKPFFEKHLPPPDSNPEILHLGSGNSTLPADLLSLAYTHQTAIDFSPVVITHMSHQHPSITWLTMDIRHLSFPASTFDICIDKATLDAMLYGSLWDPEPEVAAHVKAYVDEVARVLKPGGLWLYVTWRQPHFIRPLTSREGVWEVEVESLSGGEGMLEYFGFVLRKVG